MGKFNLSHQKVMSCKMGSIVPIHMSEVLPGDTFKMSSSAMIRLAPMAAPVMSTVNARIHHWFVPYRLIWNDWEKFITGGEDGMDNSVFPTITITESLGQSTLADYLGIPEAVEEDTTISALPFRAYALIYNEFYRDQDLQTKLTISKASGADTTTSRELMQACWDKDYFTTARPWTMKGPEVVIPSTIDESAEFSISRVPNAPAWKGYVAGTNNIAAALHALFDTDGLLNDTTPQTLSLDPSTGLTGALESGGFHTAIPDLRLGLALARYEENRSRFGGRYPEYLQFLGVNYSDARLQRPEYLGGGQQVIQMSEVLQQSPDADAGDSEATGVGTMKGHGIGAMRSNRFKRYFEEHGVVLSFMIVKPKSQYANGIHKSWLRRTKEDFWQRELEHIGQEGVIGSEISAFEATDWDPSAVWGYIDRYDSYRTGANQPAVAGEFRDSLAFWHMVRLADPMAPVPFELNDDFVSCVPTTRIYQATWEDQLWCMVNNKITASRLVTANARPTTF